MASWDSSAASSSGESSGDSRSVEDRSDIEGLLTFEGISIAPGSQSGSDRPGLRRRPGQTDYHPRSRRRAGGAQPALAAAQESPQAIEISRGTESSAAPVRAQAVSSSTAA